MIEMTLDQRKDAWIFTARQGDTVLAEVKVLPVGEDAVIHNQVFVWNRYLMGIYKEMFNDIRGVLRESGVHLLTASAVDYTDKIGKYWRLMGYEIFGDTVINGKKIHLAVMEA